MSSKFELVVFTAGMEDYADWVLDQIDENKLISFWLYRQHAKKDSNGHFIKDLSKLGRDISKVIIIDNVAENFKNTPDNGILIKSWFGDTDDNALY